MNKQTFILIILGITGISLPAAATADDNNSYAAFDAGPSIFNGQSAQNILTLIGAGNADTPLTSSFTNSTGYRLTGGYQFNSNWGMEVSYADFGESDFSIAHLAGGDASELPVIGGTRAWGWSLAGVGTLPLDDHWSLFARLGAIDARVKLFSNANTSLGTFTNSKTSTDWKATFGGGVSWSFTDDWAVRLGWDQYHDLGSSNTTGEATVNLISVGIVYSFPLTYE
ncbi:MAG: outer membrane beta-barrel protein [Gammaproteobacteria bacterium]